MRKVVVFVLGLVVMVLVARWYLGTRAFDPAPTESSSAKARLDDVREKRRVIEDDQQKRLDEALEKSKDSQK